MTLKSSFRGVVITYLYFYYIYLYLLLYQPDVCMVSSPGTFVPVGKKLLIAFNIAIITYQIHNVITNIIKTII